MAKEREHIDKCIEPCLKRMKMDLPLSSEMFTASSSSVYSQEDAIKIKKTKKVTWRGSSLYELTRLSPTNVNVPPIALHTNHEVYVKLPLIPNETPEPYPNTYTDKWNTEYVRMPNSPESMYPIKQTNGQKKLMQRWLVVKEAYQKEITSIHALRKAILHYNQRYEDRWKFEGLRNLLEEDFCEEKRYFFFQNILPKIIKLALDLPQVVTRPLLLLKKKSNQSISLSQKQIACLLANAFLCTFPRRNAKGAQTEYASYPDINFNRLFQHKEQRGLEKLKCIIHYFKEVSSRELTGMVTLSRQCIPYEDMPQFEINSLALCNLHIDSEGLIEEATGLLQMDFANKFIGGGVLGLGCVQEEIRFVLCPELIVARLFTECLDKNEALIITGVEQFSKGRGYSSSFKWDGPHSDQTPQDPCGRRLCQVLAVDAFRFGNKPHRQYEAAFITRELLKAYVGFKPLDGSKGEHIALATGNWGCGAFQGDSRLKGLIQIAAASVAGRDVAFFTFGDIALRDELADLHHFLGQHNVTVGQLVMALRQYGAQKKADGSDLVKYLYRVFSHYDSDTEPEGGSGDQFEEKSGASKDDSIGQTKGGKEDLRTAKKITHYFKPISKSDASRGSNPIVGKKSKSVPSTAEEKILEALDECDRLVKGKKSPPRPKGEGSDQSLRSSLVEKNALCPNLGPPSLASTSSNDARSTSYLFECLNKVDHTQA